MTTHKGCDTSGADFAAESKSRHRWLSSNHHAILQHLLVVAQSLPLSSEKRTPRPVSRLLGSNSSTWRISRPFPPFSTSFHFPRFPQQNLREATKSSLGYTSFYTRTLIRLLDPHRFLPLSIRFASFNSPCLVISSLFLRLPSVR